MIVVQEEVQTFRNFITQPTRRRSGSMTLPHSVARFGDSGVMAHEHCTMNDFSAQHHKHDHSKQIKLTAADVQQADTPTAQQQARCNTATDAQQESLARTTSCGPVTTRVHAAAICCKYCLVWLPVDA